MIKFQLFREYNNAGKTFNETEGLRSGSHLKSKHKSKVDVEADTEAGVNAKAVSEVEVVDAEASGMWSRIKQLK